MVVGPGMSASLESRQHKISKRPSCCVDEVDLAIAQHQSRLKELIECMDDEYKQTAYRESKIKRQGDKD